VQHISVFQKLSTGDWAFTQTDEWPLHSLKHQLSITLAATHSGDFPGSGAGWGDTGINYRYQLVGSGDAKYAVAPRLSLLLPTGNPVVDRGYGGLGLQTNLPVSIQLNRQLVTHWNVGATWVPRAQNDLHQRASSLGCNLGQSVVWLMKPRFNTLVETVWTSNPQVIAPERPPRSTICSSALAFDGRTTFVMGCRLCPESGCRWESDPAQGKSA